MSHRVPMIAYLMSVAVQSTGLHHLRDLRDKLSPEQCRKMIDSARRDRPQSRASRATSTLRETQFMNANVRKMGFLARIIDEGLRRASEDAGAGHLDRWNPSEKRQNAARRLLLTDLALRVYRPGTR